MTSTNIHAIGDRQFSISFNSQENGVVVANISVGDSELSIFFHDNKIDRALLDIDTAIRAFLQSRSEG